MQKALLQKHKINVKTFQKISNAHSKLKKTKKKMRKMNCSNFGPDDKMALFPAAISTITQAFQNAY